MYLKEIEILGFKSFAEKININLDNNITCIVGPNGSGKSNIVDAIRWVLGEQSVKSLRGDNLMSDIIFAGSKNRKSSNVASVMLTFDNSDHTINLPYNNISIKRRVYKTGENEYFLNGEKCRLKDIIEVFLDTGISKNSFNIISQGDISKILSNSPMERRIVIEEAAGIMKYKTRREEALRKLDKTMNNITRVDDIIGELSIRVEPLREQSAKAEEYLDNKRKLKEVEVALLTEEITKINSEYQTLKDKINTLNDNILVINTNISNSNIDSLKNSHLEYERKLNDLNNKLVILTREEEELNSQKKMIQERSKYDANDLKVHENIIYLKDKKLQLTSDISLIKQDILNNQKELSLLKEKVDNINNQLFTLKNKKDSLVKELFNKNKEFNENKNKISILKNNLANNDTMNLSVKRVLNNPRLSGILDAFGNILETTDKYSKALNVAISSTKTFIITDNPDSAKEAINYLKDNNLGRATFLPLNVIKPKGIDFETMDILERELDYLGLLSDFITYNDKYRNIVLNQLGNIIVVKDIDSGNKISKLINNRYKIITLDGEVIHVGGSITGGSLNNTISPITIRNELNEIILKNNSMEEVLKELNKEIENLDKEIILEEENLYKEKSEYIKYNEIIRSYLNNQELKEKELNNITIELSNLGDLGSNNLTNEEEEISKKYFEKQEEKALLVKELNSLKKQDDELKTNILNLEAEDKLKNQELREKEKELRDIELKVSKMDVILDNNLNTLNTEYELTYEKAKEEYLLDMDINDARKMVNSYKNKLKEIGMVNILAIDEFKEVNTRYEFLTNQRNDLLNAKETLLGIIDSLDDVMQEDFKNTFDELKIEFAKVFKELFKGGNASLELTDPDNLLETGVDIKACPPGKTLKTVSLLSGGEKTLTAISLLFAILNIRKVPFCIFDEVEAALDEANVDTFGHYLDNYQNKTQFLLITHKKRTMEYAKTLYGITMQESGVSKLVSVKLENN